jgi:hypothetical protein
MSRGNFKIRALENDTTILSKDKIYEFTDGYTTFDNGRISSHYKDFNDFITRNDGWKI